MEEFQRLKISKMKTLHLIQYHKKITKETYNIWESYKLKMNNNIDVRHDNPTSATVNNFRIGSNVEISRLKDFHSLVYEALQNKKIHSYEEMIHIINRIFSMSHDVILS